MDKITKVCDRCGVEAPILIGEDFPGGWERFSRYSDRHSGANAVYDFCSDCIKSFDEWRTNSQKN